MTLDQLMAAVDGARALGPLPGGPVTGLAHDSGRVGPGVVFFALPGAKADGHDYAAAAAAAGALALVVQRPVAADAPQVLTPDARLALARMADLFFGQPSRRLTMVGVTGTNGKTTLAYLCHRLLAARGGAGLVSTVEVRCGDDCRPAAMTTPEPLELQELLARMAKAGLSGAAMEVSSHGLAQHRAEAVAFDVGVFTNLSRDHLDYHGDMDAYGAAKEQLFTRLLPAARQAGKSPAAVICADDPRGPALAGRCRALGLRTLTYGLEQSADVRGEVLELTAAGGRLAVHHAGGRLELATPMVGGFNLQNLTGAAAVGLALGHGQGEIAAALDGAPGAPGRLERVGRPGRGPAVFVDYAHTDQALAGVLDALRPLTAGRLVCVFGAGGDRDQGKRPLMGLAVGRRADLAVLTSDNPRSEDRQAIMAMVEQGLREAGARRVNDPLAPGPAYLCEADRAAAIALAVASAAPGDVVLIAGKGHEDYQEVMGRRRHFDDREQAAAALAAWVGEEAGHA